MILTHNFKIMKFRINFEKIIDYIKIALVILLVTIEVAACVRAASSYMSMRLPWRIAVIISLIVCCIALTALECISMYAVKRFNVKMVIFGFDCALLLAVCIMTGNSLLSTLYCIVLTEYYMTLERFKDKTVLFICGCVLFVISFVIGWVFLHPDASLYNSIIEIFSGALFGLIALAVDYVVVIFLYSFYKTNRELTQALKQADESRAELKEAYELLAHTRVYEERNRIAKDIHDNAGHSMTAVIMQTEAAKLIIDTDPAEAKNRIISANIQAKNALEQMRESVHLLAGRNNMRSLKEELEDIIMQTFDGTDVKARYDIDDVNPEPELYRFICNSVKECLANGIRHGKATAFYIELKRDGEMLTLLVSDNGTGSGEIKEGFGLRGIREKAEGTGGACSFRREDGEGFEVEIKLPYKPYEEVTDDKNTSC